MRPAQGRLELGRCLIQIMKMIAISDEDVSYACSSSKEVGMAIEFDFRKSIKILSA